MINPRIVYPSSSPSADTSFPRWGYAVRATGARFAVNRACTAAV